MRKIVANTSWGFNRWMCGPRGNSKNIERILELGELIAVLRYDPTTNKVKLGKRISDSSKMNQLLQTNEFIHNKFQRYLKDDYSFDYANFVYFFKTLVQDIYICHQDQKKGYPYNAQFSKCLSYVLKPLPVISRSKLPKIKKAQEAIIDFLEQELDPGIMSQSKSADHNKENVFKLLRSNRF